MKADETRQSIVEEADRLFYEQGYEHTSFADIAAAVQISRGNFYYHFRTKDEILAAVIERRQAGTRAMLERWQAEGQSPAERIASFIDMMIMNRVKILQHGCPVGSLCAELAKLDHPALPDANGLFLLFREWLAGQFSALGCTATEADRQSLHLLARSQGIAALANAFRDETFLRRETAALHGWLAQQTAAA